MSGLPAIVFDAPAHYYSLPEEVLEAARCSTSDTCVVDGNAHYVRGDLEVPIIGQPRAGMGCMGFVEPEELRALSRDL